MSKDDREFVFNFINFHGLKCELTAPIAIPLSTSVVEFAYRLINEYDIPCYCHSALIEKLEDFYASELTAWHRRNAEEAIRTVVTGSDEDLERLADAWSQSFSEEHVQFAKSEVITNEEVFSDIYHTLIHSPTLNILLAQEHSYALAMETLVQKRDTELARLQVCQTQEMENAIEGLGETMTDERVNSLAVKHLEDTQMLESKWESEISALRETQKRSFQYQLVGLHEDYHTSGGDVTTIKSPESVNETSSRADNEIWTTNSERLEESFTIHLGAQLKQMHNLRLLSADVLDLCHMRPIETRNAVPQRLQTAMSLYSNNLCGLVLLVDSRVNSYTGIKRDFARSCQSSTEFHFTSLEDQLEDVRDLISKVGSWRLANKYADGESHAIMGTNNDSHSPKISVGLRPGDVYVTRHSNLPEVHVVFHVVADDSIRSSDISSRHPVILALRNVLKVACLCDVTNVTMPLLLVHEMSEEMTMSWCLKRSELIYKCIKGFMIEMASWGGAESRTVQFMVPKGISDDLFSNLSTMLPSIFRMSNPLKVKL